MSDEYEGVVEDYTVDIDTTGAIQQSPVDAGEYKLTCMKCEGRSGEGKDGKKWMAFQLSYDIPDNLSAQYISHMEFMPRMDGTPKQNEKARGDHDVFKVAHGFAQSDSIQPQDFVGREVWAYLVVGEFNGRAKNDIRSWVTSQA